MLIGQFIAAAVFGAVIGASMVIPLAGVTRSTLGRRETDRGAAYLAGAAIVSSGWLVALLALPDAFANGFRPEHAFWLSASASPLVLHWIIGRGPRAASR